MKSRIYLIITLFAFAITFFACDENTPEPEDPILAKLLNTEWKVSKVFINNKLDEQSDYSNILIKFTGEDSYSYTLANGSVETGTFTLNSTGNTISLKNESWAILELEDGKFVVEFEVDSEKIGSTIIKIEFVKA